MSAFNLAGSGALPLTGEQHPLNREFVRWLMWASATTLILGLALFFFWLFWNSRQEVAPVNRSVRLVRYTDLGVPPSIARPAPPQFNIAQAVAPPSIGVPEPVPVMEAEAPTIATQTEMTEEIASPSTGDFGLGGGDSLVVGEGSGSRTGDGHPSPEDFVAVESDPERLRMDPPVYPQIAVDAGVEGTIIVQALVSREGKVLKARALDGPEMLHEAAIACARTAIFRPALMQNKPVEVWVVMPITFKLRK